MTKEEIKATFVLLKANKSFKCLSQGIPLILQYYIVKAHKIVNAEHFIAYWRDGKSKDPLRTLIDTFYGSDKYTLNYCHSVDEGLPQLNKFVKIASKVFNKRTPND